MRGNDKYALHLGQRSTLQLSSTLRMEGFLYIVIIKLYNFLSNIFVININKAYLKLLL